LVNLKFPNSEHELWLCNFTLYYCEFIWSYTIAHFLLCKKYDWSTTKVWYFCRVKVWYFCRVKVWYFFRTKLTNFTFCGLKLLTVLILLVFLEIMSNFEEKIRKDTIQVWNFIMHVTLFLYFMPCKKNVKNETFVVYGFILSTQ
jgi:hypothetical protein